MKKMTVVFDDDELYTAVKVEAARRNIPLKRFVTEALREWLEDAEDAELIPTIQAARLEWQKKGGRPWEKVAEELEEYLERRESTGAAPTDV